MIGQERLDLYETLDWSQAIARFTGHPFQYPDYYVTQNFHGIENGYLNPIAPVTYDFVTALATPPNEYRIRQQALDIVQGSPKTIVDLGCGTGTGTLMLRQRFPKAALTGLELSPYMLVMAEYKAHQMKIEDIQWQQGLAEATGFASQSVDLVTVSMLFHETPPAIASDILAECFRVLSPGGQLLILDGHQRKLRHLKGLIQLFREPYSWAYAQGNLNDSLEIIGFQAVKTHSVGWINQLTTAIKPALDHSILNMDL